MKQRLKESNQYVQTLQNLYPKHVTEVELRDVFKSRTYLELTDTCIFGV
jgi:hypothetical protein